MKEITSKLDENEEIIYCVSVKANQIDIGRIFLPIPFKDKYYDVNSPSLFVLTSKRIFIRKDSIETSMSNPDLDPVIEKWGSLVSFNVNFNKDFSKEDLCIKFSNYINPLVRERVEISFRIPNPNPEADEDYLSFFLDIKILLPEYEKLKKAFISFSPIFKDIIDFREKFYLKKIDTFYIGMNMISLIFITIGFSFFYPMLPILIFIFLVRFIVHLKGLYTLKYYKFMVALNFFYVLSVFLYFFSRLITIPETIYVDIG